MSNFLPSLKTVELCLTYRCNVKCNNCSNLCTQAPVHGDLTPTQVEMFLDDSLRNDHYYGQITLHGGEPVLNPWIYDIARLLVGYHNKTNCKLWLLSNNSSKKVREDITRISLRYDIPLGISEKKLTNADGSGNPIEYVPVNESPLDIGEPYTLGCFQSKDCGICYNYQGFFPCSPMAAAARVFDFPAAAYSITDLSQEVIQEYFALHCKHCGFAMERKRVINQVSSKTWDDAFTKYNLKKGL